MQADYGDVIALLIHESIDAGGTAERYFVFGGITSGYNCNFLFHYRLISRKAHSRNQEVALRTQFGCKVTVFF